MAKPVTLAILGAGNRGLFNYARYAEEHPEDAQVVAVAEPREWFRNETKARHDLSSDQVFNSWRDLLEQDRIADAVVISTQDNDHTEPAVAFMRKGYDVLLEKPMAPNEQECRTIVDAQKETGVVLTICHVLRYAPYFRKMREIVQSGVLGQLATVRHMEQVGFWHYMHSYVRGNWRNEAESSPMILAKSCHDLDILLYVLGRKCLRLASTGTLSHFKAEHAPQGSADRCIDCSLAQDRCPYSATKFYGEKLRQKNHGWPLNIIIQEFNEAALEKAMREGPYGRCVYRSDNDVVDHQVVMMEFEDDISVSFTMNAFTQPESRMTEIYGSHGELRGDGTVLTHTDFTSGEVQKIDFSCHKKHAEDSHLGGDAGVMREFVDAVRNRDASRMCSGPEISLASHLMAFAAERARKHRSVEEIVL